MEADFSVFTERGASASPAKVLDAVSRLPRMAREANNPVSACPQVKMSDPARLRKLPQTDRPTV